MDPIQVEVLEEFLEILGRARDGKGNEDDKSTSRVQTLPSTNTDFESSRLRDILTGQLEAHLGKQVDQTVASKSLYFTEDVNIYRSAVVDEVVAGLEASQTFRRVVDESRAAVQRAGGLLPIRSALAPSGAAAAAAAAANYPPIGGVGAFIRRGGLSDSDAEGEGAHAKKVPRRDNHWVDIFDVLGSGFAAGRAFGSPRVDVEGALEQLKAGLANADSAASSVEALGLLAEADPELFQFGNHWPPFLELARRALDSADPAVHAKAMTLHWVMYEKSMGMCAADMCEGVLAHAKRRFAATVHVLSARDIAASDIATVPAPHAPLSGGREASGHLMIVGDSELACAAREAKALHGMLTTIHEAFQHLPESRVWDIVSDFLSLFGDVAAISFGSSPGNTNVNSDNCIPASASGGNRANGTCEPGAEGDSSGSSGGGGLFVDECKGAGGKDPPRGDLARSFDDVVVSPAHFLAVAGRVEEWLPGWLRVISTGRLVRAVQEADLVTIMTRRCDARGRILLCRPGHDEGSDLAMDATAAVFGKSLQRHRLRSVTGSSGASHSSGSSLPLGRALWLPVANLERALMKQSVSFLGIITAHCRGTLRPCPLLQTDCRNERTRAVLACGGEAEVVDEDCSDDGLRQGQDVIAALVRAVSGEARGTGAPAARATRLTRQVSAASGASTSVGRLALEYIRRLAITTAGAEPNPFIRSVVDELFAALAGVEIDGDGEVGERDPTRHDCGVVVIQEEEIPVDLGTMADIAGTLLSSRCARSIFFVEGTAGPEASLALLTVVRIAAALARDARSSRGVGGGGETLENRDSGTEPWKGIPPEGVTMEGVRSRILRGNNLVRLAVEFSWALSFVAGLSPMPRAAAWKALWQYDYPRAVDQLVAALARSDCDRMDMKKEDAHDCSSSGGDVDRDSIRDADTEYVAALRHRLLRSLVEWARDLAGASYLRCVGLAGLCGSFLSRELALRHLHPGSREECPDACLLALAARLAMYPEGFDALVCTDGGVADGVDAGLGNLGGLTNLAELLESRSSNLPPPPLRVAASGCSAEEGNGRADYRMMAMLEPVVGSDLANLRCLNFARGLSFCCMETTSRGGGIGRGFNRVRSWWRWAIIALAPRTAIADFGGSVPWKKEAESEETTEDVKVAAMELAEAVAADASVAVEMEARWSLVEALSRQKVDEVAGDAIAVGLGQSVEDEGAGNGVVSPVRGGGEGDAEGGGAGRGSGDRGIASVFDVVGVLEPVSLKRARLAISLACLGGPTEERHARMRRIRAVAASAALTGHFRGGQATPGSGVVLSRNGSRPMAEAVEFPSSGLSDREWWDAAAHSAFAVAAALSRPEGFRRKEALDVLTESISRRSLAMPESGRRNGARRGTYVSVGDGDDEQRDAGAAPGARAGAGVTADRMRAVMQDMCFSYARSLGLVDGNRSIQFSAGWRATMAAAGAAAADGGASLSSKLPVTDGQNSWDSCTAAECCDWFAAVVFLVFGSDGEAASKMLKKARTHANSIIFVWPFFGKMYATAATAEAEATAEASLRSTRQDPVNGGNSPSRRDLPRMFEHIGGATIAAAAVASLGDPPLLVLAALVEEVLEEELPRMAVALRRSGWAAAQIAARWMRQCLLGIVDWSDAVAYMVLALLRGHDYQVYFVVALLRAAQPRVVDAASAGLDLSTLLLEGEALEGFQAEASIAFMEGLEQRHRARCLEAMRAFLSQRAW